jgi:putative transposase
MPNEPARIFISYSRKDGAVFAAELRNRLLAKKLSVWQDLIALKGGLRWTAAGMMEAAKGFRRLKAYKQLPALKAVLAAHQVKHTIRNNLEENRQAA